MSEADNIKEVIETLEDAGFEVTDGEPGHGTCERCGLQNQELRMGGCWICGCWEDPSADDKELLDGAATAYEYGHTLEMWLAGRRLWGKLVPPQELIDRIYLAILVHAQSEKAKLEAWLAVNKPN